VLDGENCREEAEPKSRNSDPDIAEKVTRNRNDDREKTWKNPKSKCMVGQGMRQALSQRVSSIELMVSLVSASVLTQSVLPDETTSISEGYTKM
jgi:hypothetical protein